MAAFAVNTDTSVRSGTLQVAEEESLATTHRGAVLDASTQGQSQLAVLRHVDVQVRTVVETLVSESLVVIVRESLEERILVQETRRNEISHLVRTALHVHVYLLLPCGILHQVVNPVCVREGHRHVTLAEMLHHVLAKADTRVVVRRVVSNRCRARPLTHWQSVRDSRVVPHLSIGVGISEFHELRNLLDSSAGSHAHRSLAWRTTLRRHEDYTVSTTHTEHGSGGCVLQDGDVLDFVRVDLTERTFHTVHEHQWLSTIQRTDTTHANHRLVVTRHTRSLYH